ncbi:hypothetical protein ACTVKP_20990 [Serratia bockelmannii]|uniref:hypothetical protein n=1 Tax=Serratia bockelmannii TaxID=2703793 RepID=UPI003FA6F436
MDNKLSELSKPVAWSDERRNLCTNTIKERGLDSKYRQDYEKYSTPIYSQEYVSALLAENERVASDLVARNGEIEGLRKRAAELETHNVCLIKKNADLTQQNIKLGEQLATPVRLPQLCGDGDNDSEYTEGLNDGITQSAIYLRRQGFTVEGDEQ